MMRMIKLGAPTRAKAPLALSLLMAVLGCSFNPLPSQAKLRSLSKLAVIGDSYSDAGNSGLLTKSTVPPGFPFPSYANGRFTNGPVAVEQLWSLFNPSQPPLQPSLAPGGTNFAVGGATSGRNSYFQVAGAMPDSLRSLYASTSAYSQLSQLLSTFTPGSFDPSSTLFVFWMGPNDGLYWLNTPQSPTTGLTPGTIVGGLPAPATATEMLENSMYNIGAGVQALIGIGAQHLLVPNLMDFSKAPGFSGDPAQAAAVQALSLNFNQGLDQTLNKLRALNPGVDIMSFDTYALFEEIFANPTSYGFTNSSQACTSIDNSMVFPTGCSPTADGWLFWDGVHVTSAAHGILASNLYQTVYAAPGPLPVAGSLVALGWARRLRQRQRRAQTSPSVAEG